MSAASEHTVVFVHIPKTAGITFRSLLDRHYPPDRRYWVPDPDSPDPEDLPALDHFVDALRSLPTEQLQTLDLVGGGHFPFGIHEALPRPARYITFIREPIDRVVSFYYFLRSHPSFLHSSAHYLTLREFAEQNITGNLHNGQTAFLAGKGLRYERCFDQDLLVDAKANIRAHFAAVGVTERFDESLLVLRRQLGWGRPLYYREQNVNRARSREELDTETRASIEALTELDQELYKYANALLDAEIERLGIDVRKELLSLRVRSRAYRAAYLVSRVPPHMRWRLERLLNSIGALGG